MDEIPNLNANLETMDIEELLEYQQSLTRARLAVNDKARATQEAIDGQAEALRARRAEEDARFGQRTKPPAQDLF